MRAPATGMANAIDRDGFAILDGMLTAAEVERLRGVAGLGAVLSRSGSAYGGRNCSPSRK